MRYTAVFRRILPEDVGKILPMPMYESGVQDVRKIGEGEVRSVVIKNPRNLKKHNQFMAILRMVVANSDGRWRSVDHILLAVKRSLGLYDIDKGFDGKDMTNYNSISFEAMDQEEFMERVFTPGMELLSEDSGVSVGDLLDPRNSEEYNQ